MAKAKSTSKSKFDFQGFLLEKGEKIGLIVAGVGFALLALFGVMAAAGAANQTRLASDISAGIASIDDRLKETPDQPAPVEIPNKDSIFVKVKSTDFPTFNELFNTAGNISDKRNNPTILNLVEGVAKYHTGAFGVVMIQNDQVAVIQGRQAPAMNKSRDIFRAFDKNKNKGQSKPGDPNAPPPPAANPGGQAKASGKGDAKAAGSARSTEGEIVYIPIGAPEINDAVFAVNLRPVRMARIQGIVPYKDQVAQHQRALRLDSDAALTAERKEPVYRGFIVQRKILGPDGTTVVQDWSDFDHEEVMRRFQEPAPGTLLRFAAYEKIDGKLKEFVPELIHRLFMPAPLLAHGSYEPVQLNELGKAIQDMEKTGPKKDLTNRETAMKGKDDQFAPIDLVAPGQVPSAGPSISGGAGGPPPRGAGAGKGETRGGPPNATSLAARTSATSVWLLQFIDPTIEAGYYYQYRVKLKAENPNYNQPELVSSPGEAEKRELISNDWFDKFDTVFAMPEEYMYVQGEKYKERALYGSADYDTTTIRYHRWFDYVRVTRDGGLSDPIGEWVVADLAAKRGQYIQEHERRFRLPLWSMVANAYTFRDPISKIGTAASRRMGENVLMDFSPLTPVLLVDFDGGSGNYRVSKGPSVKDECAGEILIINDDGKTMKLSAQNTVADKLDPKRKAREDAWQKWLEDVRTGADKPANSGNPAGKGG